MDIIINFHGDVKIELNNCTVPAPNADVAQHDAEIERKMPSSCLKI